MYLHVDRRVAGKPRYFMSKNQAESFMLVPDVVLKSIIFLGTKHPKDDNVRPSGTAFFVCLLGEPRPFVYLVTAKHCIDGIRNLKDKGLSDGKVYLKVNSPVASLPPIQTDHADWLFHPFESEKVDVAVYPIMDGYDGWDVQFFTLIEDMTYVNARVIESDKIGPGDEVFIAGLFTKHAGKKRNIPIIRTGNIAAMSEEPVNPGWCHPHSMEAYLIEAKSIGGLSSSFALFAS